jgi:tetratricopeptide (TPR) repeat protein
LEEALPLYRQVGNLLGEANCIKGLGDIALARSDHEGARDRYEEALLLYRQVSALLGQANCIQSLGDIALARSDYVSARDRYEEALSLYERLHDPYSIGRTHRRLARLAVSSEERCQEAEAARLAWASIGRGDLIADLGNEFSDCG